MCVVHGDLWSPGLVEVIPPQAVRVTSFRKSEGTLRVRPIATKFGYWAFLLPRRVEGSVMGKGSRTRNSNEVRGSPLNEQMRNVGL